MAADDDRGDTIGADSKPRARVFGIRGVRGLESGLDQLLGMWYRGQWLLAPSQGPRSSPSTVSLYRKLGPLG